MLRLLLHLTVFLSYSLCLLAQTIPATRLVNWQSAGLDVPFILPENTINVLDFGAVGNNSNNDAPAIQAAINSLGANGGIVYIPSGTYLMQSGLNLLSGVSLRGASATTTHLRFRPSCKRWASVSAS